VGAGLLSRLRLGPGMKRDRVLVIGPFDEAGRDLYEITRAALHDVNAEAYRLDDVELGTSWADTTFDAIRASDFLIVDITGKNPNVFYELGFAHAMRKPTILLVSSESLDALPSDLAGFHYIVYDPKNLRSLREHVRRAATAFVDAGD
jgi:hypothetical protein